VINTICYIIFKTNLLIFVSVVIKQFYVKMLLKITKVVVVNIFII